MCLCLQQMSTGLHIPYLQPCSRFYTVQSSSISISWATHIHLQFPAACMTCTHLVEHLVYTSIVLYLEMTNLARSDSSIMYFSPSEQVTYTNFRRISRSAATESSNSPVIQSGWKRNVGVRSSRGSSWSRSWVELIWSGGSPSGVWVEVWHGVGERAKRYAFRRRSTMVIKQWTCFPL